MLSAIKRLFTIDVDYKSRVYGFDIMRGMGILIVLYAHGRDKSVYFHLPTHNFFVRFSYFKAMTAFNDFISVLGFWLMDLFFVLSGFLIGMILIKFYEKEKTFDRKTAYNFWIRRWLRTLPNYYLVLFLAAGLWALNGNVIFFKLKFLAHMLFCQTLVTRPPFFMEESWTLCIEEWFYLLFPIILLICNKVLSSIPGTNKHIKRNILVSIILFFCLPMLLRIVVYLNHPDLTWIDMSRMSFFRMDTIAIGILTSWINYYYPDIFKKYRNLFGIGFILLISIYFIYFYAAIMPGIRLQLPIKFFPIFSITLFLVLSGLASMCLTVYMKEVKMRSATLFAKFITIISLTSYSIYIFHRSVVAFIIDKLYPATTGMENIILFFVYFIGSILVSILVFKYFEFPMTELREKLKR